MREGFRRAGVGCFALCCILWALWAAARTEPDRNREPSLPVLTAALESTGTRTSLLLCVGYYDARGKCLGLELTPDIQLNRVTGEAVLPVRAVPRRAAKMRVFLLDGALCPAAQVTEADLPLR